jgi:hypothetical protein
VIHVTHIESKDGNLELTFLLKGIFIGFAMAVPLGQE